MKILMNTGGLAQTNCFLIADEATKQAVLFDAPDSTVLPLMGQARARGWEVVGLWLTHGHFDHIADHEVVTAHFPSAKVIIHHLEQPKLQQAGVQSRMFQLPFTIPPRSADELIEDGQTLAVGSLSCKVMVTPGHAPGHVAFHFEKEEVLVGGDLIIGGSIGRTDLPDSNHADLERSIRTIMRLPPSTRLLPGHGQPSTLADERASNLFVQQILAAG
ncbi:MAG TPA: MBL fold metallo-hydrolase [Tepidisphaeraceae bacterium]|nr:MBL fold metallo-hydrolase [Tepidisphaeraceae bacterium]